MHCTLLTLCFKLRWEAVAAHIPLELLQQQGILKGMSVAMQFYQRRLRTIQVSSQRALFLDFKDNVGKSILEGSLFCHSLYS